MVIFTKIYEHVPVYIDFFGFCVIITSIYIFFDINQRNMKGGLIMHTKLKKTLAGLAALAMFFSTSTTMPQSAFNFAIPITASADSTEQC